MLKVLLWMTFAVDITNANKGGHRILMEETASHLRHLNIDAQVSYANEPIDGEFDIVHSFGVNISHLRRFRQCGVPIIISPIYWEIDYLWKEHGTMTLLERLKSRVRTAAVLSRSAAQDKTFRKCLDFTQRVNDLRASFELADMLLPNSEGEANAIINDLVVTTPMHVVPCGVSPSRFEKTPVGQKRDSIIYLGRFEPHKNQLGLIKAMKSSPHRLILAGYEHPHHPNYIAECRRQLGPNMEIYTNASNDEINNLLAKSKVHVLPSWYETAGLVSLEAALAGCNIVTTSRGFARDYFGEMAWYCDPSQPDSIRHAITEAFNAPYQSRLKDTILSRYTWAHTAEATLAAYKKILSTSVRRNNYVFASTFEDRSLPLEAISTK